MKITVFRWKKYDIAIDEERTSKRYATRETIGELDGQVIEGSAIEIDERELSRDFPGMTDRNFKPQIAAEFQRQVLP